jgi:hypothetical protein
MHGHELLETLRSLEPAASAAAFLRHAERFPIVDLADPTLAELTPAGMEHAEDFGARITGFECVRLFHSPVKRCQQTAACIALGASAAGLAVEMAGAQEVLGVNFILNPVEIGRLACEHGDAFLRLWFTRQVPEDVIRPASGVATSKLAYLAEHLREPSPAGRRLDLHISHDWNAMILREYTLGLRHEEAGWITFLDGMAFACENGGLRAVYRAQGLTRPLPWSF